MSTSAENVDHVPSPPFTRVGTAPLKLPSHALLRGLRKIIIDHEGTEYTLHLTRQNKLLLTK